MHARVLKFHRWIPHGKIADTRCFFYFCFLFFVVVFFFFFFFVCCFYFVFVFLFCLFFVVFFFVFVSYAPLKKVRIKSCQHLIFPELWPFENLGILKKSE